LVTRCYTLAWQVNEPFLDLMASIVADIKIAEDTPGHE
jgi:hypothetical protein